jgi:glycosyltransferase involved in cell wall biosynthesis
VVYLIDFLTDQGGAERFTLGLATHLPQDRFEPVVCSARGADEAAVAALRGAGVRHVGLGRRTKWDVHQLGGLARMLRREPIDVLHAHMFGSNLWGSVIGTACRVPILLAHEHTWSYTGDPLRTWLDGHVIGRLVTRFISVSPADAERMINQEGVPADKVIVLPTAYVPGPAGAASDIRNELGLAAETPLIASAVALRPQKALEVMLDAMALVHARVPSAHLLIAGSGSLLPRLEQHARERGVAGQVHFLGIRHDVDSILRQADVGALSSDYEGMPLFAFECMAARTPLVSTAVGALPGLLENGRAALLVPPRDPPALAAALTEVLTDPARRHAIAEAAAEGLERYTIEAVTAQFADLYEQLAGEARR